MSLFDSIFDKSVVIKVKYENNNETIVRKLLIDKNITLDKFHEKLRSRFAVSLDVKTGIYYKDEDNDLITVTFDDELFIALKSHPPAKFELAIKLNSNDIKTTTKVHKVETSEEIPRDENPKEPKTTTQIYNVETPKYENKEYVPTTTILREDNTQRNRSDESAANEIVSNETISNDDEIEISDRITYPAGLIGDIDEYIEVRFKSKNLVKRNNADYSIWGTKIYTFDSDLLSALLHTFKIKLTRTPPPHDIIATVKVLPGQTSYTGSTNNGIMTSDWDSYNLSFEIVKIRYEPINNSSSS